LISGELRGSTGCAGKDRDGDAKITKFHDLCELALDGNGNLEAL
jgi:hypothetical protein